MSAILDKLRELPAEALEMRLIKVTKQIELTARIFRGGLKSAHIYLWGPSDELGCLAFEEGEEQPEQLKDFIHHFCTALCAEKMMLETLLGR